MTIRTFLITILIASTWVSPTFAETEPLKTVVNPAHLADTTQYGYSQAAIISPAAKVIYIAGQIGVSADGPITAAINISTPPGSLPSVSWSG